MLLFIDESGQDNKEMPCEVLAGVAIAEAKLWDMIKAIRAIEKEYFGDYLRNLRLTEVKAKRLLKRKCFRFANQKIAILEAEMPGLANSFLRKGLEAHKSGRNSSPITAGEATAYNRLVLKFVDKVIDKADDFGAKIFASVVDKAAARAQKDVLGKDFTYLFERYFHFLETLPSHERGLVVFDELEKSRAQKLVQQMASYFLGTAVGQFRSSKIIPEPFFVHSELTTGVFLADLAAYIIGWGWRRGKMDQPCRQELKPYAQKLNAMQFKGVKPDVNDEKKDWPLYGITYIEDLRAKSDRDLEDIEP